LFFAAKGRRPGGTVKEVLMERDKILREKTELNRENLFNYGSMPK